MYANVGIVQALAGRALEVASTAEQFKQLGFMEFGSPFQKCWI